MNQAPLLPFKRIGKDVIIWDKAKIVLPETIEIGNKVTIDDFCYIAGSKTSQTIFGDFVHIASHAFIGGSGELIMEDFTGLSGGSRIYTGNDQYMGECMTNVTVPEPYRIAHRGYVHVKKHALIGAGAIILPDVTIGEGCIIGANSLVKKDCEPWTVYFGTPAVAIRMRPSGKILELEQELKSKLYDSNGCYIPLS